MNSIDRRTFLELMAGSALFTCVGSYCARSARKPNIVLILSDDHGWTQLGCYGSSYYETPNIDRMAQQGMRFTDAYAAAPICSPTRASIMTGKYPGRVHLTDFIKGGKPPAGSALKHPEWTKYLPLEEVTVAELLKKAGYKTASFGKWHLSEEKTPPESLSFNPDRQGFDEHFVTYKPSRNLAQSWQTPEEDGHNVKLITEKAVQFIESNKDQPFFLYMPHNTIHNPLIEKSSLIGKYKAKSGVDEPENNPIIAAMLETLDNSVGAILEKLVQSGLEKDTLVIFYSDNGGLEKDADQTPLRSGKASLYEGGIRVPFIARWPGTISPGQSDSTVVSTIDLFPTILAAAGIYDLPSEVDGLDLMPVLTGKGESNRNAIYWHYPHYHSAGEGPCGAIREGDYKLIEWYEATLLDTDNQVELYNLKTDIGEQNNLAESMPDKANAMRAELARWRKSVGAQMPLLK